MVHLADALNKCSLWATHTRAPPPQLVVYSRDPAPLTKVSEGIKKQLLEKGHSGRTTMMIIEVKGRSCFYSWSVSIQEDLEKPLHDKGYIMTGMQSFQVRRYLVVPKCRRCLMYGHDMCNSKPCCYKCGAEDHQAWECASASDYCIPCKKEGLDHWHRGTRFCNSYQMHLEHIKAKTSNNRRFQKKNETRKVTKSREEKTSARDQ